MQQTIGSILSQLIADQESACVRFPADAVHIPPLAFRVNFPRLEIVLEGELRDLCLSGTDNTLRKNQALYIPAGHWNFPQWHEPTTTLSILFSKKKIGFSVQRWDGNKLHAVDKQHVARLGPRVGSYLLLAMNETVAQAKDQATADFIFAGLLSHCIDLQGKQRQASPRSQVLFEAIQEYVDEHSTMPLTREDVARAFHITPNYLSALFKKTGGVGFTEYLNHVRLERAKELLKGYDMKVKEIAHTCGFVDSNYFCRVFKKSTAASPSEYRCHYRSQATEK
ncbi:helix-turn-helix transcriptional regulator [Serratia marcescens]|uniref:helix-turn-helix transcriptional regulator n=1 Tax=Serratia marcescens TaxID=615 RepID=UPI001C5A4DD4|nr:helix-turn-helix transcriptional regulator [Serratia marcescens]QXX95828.1 helix-turn-helix transcriptional regulator [Serratia marcescens]